LNPPVALIRDRKEYLSYISINIPNMQPRETKVPEAILTTAPLDPLVCCS